MQLSAKQVADGTVVGGRKEGSDRKCNSSCNSICRHIIGTVFVLWLEALLLFTERLMNHSYKTLVEVLPKQT